ncbi:MAG: minichromosome maintenance protein MCM [Candidatus Altiarchaeales archaeon]|nr:minichromosome maintenance protein MCM [Candidatus Altiarchaeota archaeon]MBU4266557.1 minichromosome maintenance protein MCM [Candidatus Altiarchaeota archaeon]MBU4341716.1 minichromosome maintenance protein MCM [Candidatus Altiarchaeota archaeon]MBU4437320.1 minichromosome maintenance protein MCM [Candidatus Altiarchaeota archaeon]MCG2783397.1 minichromosome maintenance protein MCM [Candidatus Altiarchaeales archaeon]
MEKASEKLGEFLNKKSNDINKVAEIYPEVKSLLINYEELEKFDHGLAEGLIAKPDDTLEILQTFLKEKISVAPELMDDLRINVRFYNIPKEKGYTILVRELRSKNVGAMMALDGLVNKITDIFPKIEIGRFYCNKCNESHDEPQVTRFLQQPPFCNNCKRREFRFVPEESKLTDIQKLEIQEPLEMLKGGAEARRIEVWVEDDLTDAVCAGDRVVVTGIMRLLPPKKGGSVYLKYIEGNNIEGIAREFEDIEISKKEEREIKKLAKDPKIHDHVIASIAPGIWGYNEVKEAIALQLFGGRGRKRLPDGTALRPDIHLLLVGDPGVAKSRLLQYVNQVAPKSIYVTGKGTTGAGLTATAEKDDFGEGGWTLKAGALVLAGGGVVCIDEFDKMDKEDRSAMHEAMEQQTISVAKAGMVTRFIANTAVLAASNPKFSRFDSYKPLGEQFDIPPTLLSRFDLIFPIRDIVDKEKDAEIADHMLKMHKTPEEAAEIQPAINTELFMKYIAYSRKNIRPVMTDDAAEKIKAYYVDLRGGSQETVRATPRQLEALVRLAEASAKIRLSDTVTVSDADRAIRLTNFVLREVAYDAATGEIDIDRIGAEYPKSDRDKIKLMEDIIRGLLAESGDGSAHMDDVLREAEGKEIDKFKAEKIINELKNKGIIYEPRHGRFMFTEHR